MAEILRCTSKTRTLSIAKFYRFQVLRNDFLKYYFLKYYIYV